MRTLENVFLYFFFDNPWKCTPLLLLCFWQPILDFVLLFHLSISLRPHHSSIISCRKWHWADSTHDPPPRFILRLTAKDAKATIFENKIAMYALLIRSTWGFCFIPLRSFDGLKRLDTGHWHISPPLFCWPSFYDRLLRAVPIERETGSKWEYEMDQCLVIQQTLRVIR